MSAMETRHIWRCDTCQTGADATSADDAKSRANQHNQVKHPGGNDSRPITYRMPK